ncbi:hypothetical protein GALL_135620 [mine drainage metagenome]|uniref:Uncharacterized protein n=1 Tax=mine drainage metagenome TaxID=410659 RepID=A0A1J5S898_9ZZZZ
MKPRSFSLFALPLLAFGQTLPPAPSGTDPVHNSPLTDTEFIWFTNPGHLSSTEGDYTRSTISQAELAAALVPADPAVRYANFKPRVGTVLPTDDPKTWNWDRADRAQMQDAYYQLLEPSWNQLPVWTNWVTGYTPDAAAAGGYRATFHKAGDAGGTDPAWRNSVYLHLNFARYLSFGANHVRYVTEDPKVLPWVQHAAYWMAGNDVVTHTPGSSSLFYSDLAYQGCFRSNLDDDYQTVNVSVWTYLVDPGNYYPGHRMSLLNDGATRVAVGSFQVDPVGLDPSWGHNALWIRDPLGAAPALERDPLKTVTVYPSPGYIPCPLLADASVCNPAFEVMFSVTFDGRNAILSDAMSKNLSVSVRRNGLEIPIKDARWSNQTFYFTVNLAWDDRQEPGTAGYYAQLDPSGFGDDQTYVVTYRGIQFATDNVLGPSIDQDPIAYSTRDFSYTFTLFNPEKVVQQYAVTRSKIVGISGRSNIGTGDDIEVAGFQITGSEPLRVALRAQGPGLASQGVKNPASSTQVRLFQIQADGSNPEIGSNRGWRKSPNWRLLQSCLLSPTADNEAALVATLPPGLYTAEVSDPTGVGGVGIAEIYSIDTVSQSQLSGISSRAVVGTGEQALVAGFIITSPMTVMIRAQGPSLEKQGVSNVVRATKLALVRISDMTTLATNSGWKSAAYQNDRFSTDLAGVAPGSADEAAVILHLEPGTYTATVEAADGVPGVGLVEVYQVPDAA